MKNEAEKKLIEVLKPYLCCGYGYATAVFLKDGHGNYMFFRADAKKIIELLKQNGYKVPCWTYGDIQISYKNNVNALCLFSVERNIEELKKAIKYV